MHGEDDTLQEDDEPFIATCCEQPDKNGASHAKVPPVIP